ncbi:MAG: hypothetical protein H0W68_09240 [Gemmatimonadaceae bacterium]|nr:hypothetical protein [Gemmatimonadaceae bacterium]
MRDDPVPLLPPPPVPSLALDSSRWSELTQAYGTAEDIPQLLIALEQRDSRAHRELFLGLWATLCPGDTVTSAAFAATPHLLQWSVRRPSAERALALHLMTEIELRRAAVGAPAVPADLAAAHDAAVRAMTARAAPVNGDTWSADVAQVMAAALVMGHGHGPLARAILALGESGEGAEG